MNKKDKNEAIKLVATVGTGVIGGMVSNAIVAPIPVDNMVKLAINGGLTLVSAFAATKIKGNSLGVAAGRGAVLGVAIEQFKQLITGVAKETGIVEAATEESETGDKILSGFFGLGCGCQSNNAMPLVRMPSLNMASYRQERGYNPNVITANAFN